MWRFQDKDHCINVDRFDTVTAVRSAIQKLGIVKGNFRLRSIVYRKNGTFRPSKIIDDDASLVREHISVKNIHIYVDMETTTLDLHVATLHISTAVYLIIRRWDVERNAVVDVGGVTVPNGTSVLEMKSILRQRFNVFYDIEDEDMILVEEETPYLFQMLSTGTTLRMSNIISGDIIHVERFDIKYHGVVDGHHATSLTANYYFQQTTHMFRFEETSRSFNVRSKQRMYIQRHPKRVQFTLSVNIYTPCSSLLVQLSTQLRVKKTKFTVCSRVKPQNVLILDRSTRIIEYLCGNVWFLLEFPVQ